MVALLSNVIFTSQIMVILLLHYRYLHYNFLYHDFSITFLVNLLCDMYLMVKFQSPLMVSYFLFSLIIEIFDTFIYDVSIGIIHFLISVLLSYFFSQFLRQLMSFMVFSQCPPSHPGWYPNKNSSSISPVVLFFRCIRISINC